jgi:hypothetical protein
MRPITVLTIACCALLLGAWPISRGKRWIHTSDEERVVVVEYKYYARNVGPVLRTNAEGGGRGELVSFTKE